MTVLEERGLLDERLTNVFDAWAFEAAREIQKDKWRWDLKPISFVHQKCRWYFYITRFIFAFL